MIYIRIQVMIHFSAYHLVYRSFLLWSKQDRSFYNVFLNPVKSSHSSRCPNLVNCPLQFFSNFPDFFLTWHRTSTQLYSETRWHLIGPKKQKPWSTINSSISTQLTACSPEYHKERPKFPIFQKPKSREYCKKNVS